MEPLKLILIGVVICYQFLNRFSMGKSYQQVDQLRYDFLHLEENLRTIKRCRTHNTSEEIELTKSFLNFDKKMKQVEDLKELFNVNILLNSWPYTVIKTILHPVEHKYKIFRQFIHEEFADDYAPHKRTEWLALQHTKLLGNGSTNLEVNLKDITTILAREDLVNQTKQIVTPDDVCRTRMPINRVLYSLYNLLQLVQLKAYVIVSYTYMFDDLYRCRGPKNVNAKQAQTTYLNMARILFQNVYNATEHDHDSTIWNCYPTEHIKDKTYIQITNLLQAFVYKENLGTRNSKCLKQCSGKPSNGSKSSTNDTCAGNISDCRSFRVSLRVFFSNESNSYRRYQYFLLGTDFRLGEYHGVRINNTNLATTYRDEKYWGCEYCICLCDDDKRDSVRYFSLHFSKSDASRSRIVAGVRFVRLDQVIYIQVREAKLLPQGFVDRSTLRWVPIQPINVTNKFYKSGIDYFKMTPSNRIMYLGIIEASQENVAVTGVRFKSMKIGGLGIEILTAPYDFASGQLLNPTSKSLRYELKVNRKVVKDIDLAGSSVRHLMSNSHVRFYENDRYVRFQASDLEDDIGQTTVPFFEALPVEPQILVPLKGIGLYLKRTDDSPAFIGLKLVPFDLYNHLFIASPFPTPKPPPPPPPMPTGGSKKKSENSLDKIEKFLKKWYDRVKEFVLPVHKSQKKRTKKQQG